MEQYHKPFKLHILGRIVSIQLEKCNFVWIRNLNTLLHGDIFIF